MVTWLILPLDCPRIAGPEYISTSWIAEMAVIHKCESRDLPTLLGSPRRTSLRLAAHELLIDGKHRPSLLPAADICVTKLFVQGRSHGKTWRGTVYRCYESQRKHFPSHIAVHTDVNFSTWADSGFLLQMRRGSHDTVTCSPLNHNLFIFLLTLLSGAGRTNNTPHFIIKNEWGRIRRTYRVYN